jgi:DNA-binding MarR family transcriptional regulator
MATGKNGSVVRRKSAEDSKSGPLQHQQQVHDALRSFRIIMSSVRRHFRWIEEQCGISGAQLWALGQIQQTPNCKVSNLAAAMSIHQSTASNLVEKLESKGLIEKRRDQPDQRVVRLCLTGAGEKVMSRAPMPFDGLLPNALSALPAASLNNLNLSLIELLEHMAIKDSTAATTPLSDID